MQSYSASALANIGKKAAIPSVIEALQKNLKESDFENVQTACNKALEKLLADINLPESLMES